jgi:DNA-directed RNA polymerase subunit beta-beta'
MFTAMPVKEKFFGRVSDYENLPDLIGIQKKSYADFLQKNMPSGGRKNQGLQKAFKDIFPVASSDKTIILEFLEYLLGDPKYDIDESLIKGVSYACILRGKFRVTVKEKDSQGKIAGVKEKREEEVYIGEIPLMTENATFVINGAERVVVNQLHRSPGICYDKEIHATGKAIYSCRIIPYRGSWLEFQLDVNNILHVSIDRKKKFLGTILLRSMGYSSNEEMLKAFDLIETVHLNRISENKILGRLTGDRIINLEDNAVAIDIGTSLTKPLIKKIKKAGIKKINLLVDEKMALPFISTLKADPYASERDPQVAKASADLDLYRRLRPGYPANPEHAKVLLGQLFFDEKRYDLEPVGRYKLNKKLDLNIPENQTVLCQEDFIAAVKYLIRLSNGVGSIEDIDHLGNRRVRTVGELVQHQVEAGLARMERSIREKMNFQDSESVMPHDLINPKLVSTVIKDFFARSQLCQFMQQTNPLDELTHKRRLSATGPGGLNRERAGFEVRDIHPSHYGRICPIETPEGANIGLIVYLGTYTRINKYGFMETPYLEVKKGKTGEIRYLTADEEYNYVIAQANARVDKKGRFIDKEVFVRKAGEYTKDSPDKVQFIDISPRQLVGVTASLIPFLEHDDVSRALMGSNMQRQAVPLLTPERPLIGTGMEKIVVRDSGALILAKASGIVEYVSSEEIRVRRDNDIIDVYNLKKFIKSNQYTCINQKAIVSQGQKVKKNDCLADGPATKNGHLALGVNVLVAFMPWRGYNFEDAILINQRLVKDDVYTSVHIEEFSIEARETKIGLEEITRDIPNVNEDVLKNLDEKGIVRCGAEVKSGNILVGKVTPKTETELSPEEKLLRAIFGEKAGDVRDTSLVVPPGVEGIVIDTKMFSQKDRKNEKNMLEEKAEVNKLKLQYNNEISHIYRDIQEKVKVLLLNKASAVSLKSKTGKVILRKNSRFTAKVINSIKNWDFSTLKIKRAPELTSKIKNIFASGKEIIDIANEKLLKKIETIKKGDELPPGVIKLVRVFIATKRKISVGDKMAGRHGNKGVIAKILSEEDMPFLKDGTPVDIVLNPLGVPSRMNVGQILETHLGWAANALGLYVANPVFDSAGEKDIKHMLNKAGLPEDGQDIVYDGYTGKPFQQKVTVGYIYMMKLSHLVDDKVHARSIGPYSLVTQQPLGGKAQFGGQRFGEMEVWALEAYGAAYTLQELLTVKSDDVEGRTRIYEAIVKGKNSLKPGSPESFNVLMKELQGLVLDVRMERDKNKRKINKLETFMKEGINGKRDFPFDWLSFGLASSEAIRSWSRGEVKKPETINYRTFKPEKDGLFCEKIFGPVKDWECNCGKYKRIKHKGVICDRCGVEVTQSKVRRERMGHINLAAPVTHIWFFKVMPSQMANFFGISARRLEQVVYYEKYIVIDSGNTPVKKLDIFGEEQYREYREKYGKSFKVGMGAEALEELLKKIDLNKSVKELKEQIIETNSRQKKLKLAKRLKIIESFKESGNKPEWIVLRCLPVIPPDLRPLVPLDGGRFATSDLNDLYRRVINRNERLKNLLIQTTPDIIIRNEKRMLQEAVDALFDNGRRGRVVTGSGNRPLKSLSDMLKGKQGRFRQNLLGKRVDYSGRSVIVVGPELRLDQCGLPKKMALELFEPFIIRKLKERGYVHTIKSAKKMVNNVKSEVWDILEDIIKDHPVLLNRAPTLHRLGIQAFYPSLIEGNAIRIHPLVCAAFNADFDGDQMAVHIPLSLEAQLEAEILMLGSRNIFSSSSGQLIATPTREIVLGCCYLTKEIPGPSEKKIFFSPEEVLQANLTGRMNVNQRIKVLIDGKVIRTTSGRIIFNNILPEGMPFINKELDRNELHNIIAQCHEDFGRKTAVKLLDDIKTLGFEWATLAGISICVDDMEVPKGKEVLLKVAEKEVDELEKRYKQGLITDRERHNKVIDVWMQARVRLSDMLFQILRKGENYVVTEKGELEKRVGFNSILMMGESGARGGSSQISQLAGMRGPMAKPSGDIIERPITSNFREGLTVLEYFISAHGARKGLTDTALKTADSGYLTRRLVDVSQEVIILEEDCGTINSILAKGVYTDRWTISLKERIVGRVAAEDIVIPLLKNEIVKAGEIITPYIADVIEEAGIEEVRIRSVLTCESEKSVCAKCYGVDLSNGKLVKIGEAVGIIAAQSIGEPGTQLTMRTFHIGGTASRIIEEAEITAGNSGILRFNNLRTVKNKSGEIVVLNRTSSIGIYDNDEMEIENHKIPLGAVVRFEDGVRVKKGDLLVFWDPHMIPILAEVGGKIKFEDIIEGVTMKKEKDNITKKDSMVIIEHKEEFYPQIVITGKNSEIFGYHSIPRGATIMVKDGQKILAGDFLARVPRDIGKTTDITGGLPRVVELFEARKPKDPAQISAISGTVEFAGASKGMRKIVVRNESGMSEEYLIPPGKHLTVHKGEKIPSGYQLTEGPVVPKDILSVGGPGKLQEYILNHIQEVYRGQGVKINDKHIEVIIRQMLGKVEIEDGGDTKFLIGERIDKLEFRRENERVVKKGGKPAQMTPVLLGITRASLSSDSPIASASFQETTRVLAAAAASGKKDYLKGLKENIIIGHPIPAGTGLAKYRQTQFDIKKTAKKEKEKEEEEKK